MTDQFDTPIRRDRWGRPLIIPAGGGKAVAYTRCTTFVSALEDTYNLGKWQMRMVALGLADRPDLVLSVAAHRSDKDELNRIADAALEAAKARAAATTGTALHALAEQMDRGQTVGLVPKESQADLDAYSATTKSLNYIALEQFRVHDEMKIGGTTDRVIDLGDKYLIGDIKTGGIEYGIGKIAMQLAVYAHSTPYDHQNGQRVTEPKPMDLERGLVIHLPAGTATCILYWVDIAAGWEAVQLAQRVREWRSRKGLSTVAEMAATDLGSIVAQHTDIDELRRWFMTLPATDRNDGALLAACQTRKAEILSGAA